MKIWPTIALKLTLCHAGLSAQSDPRGVCGTLDVDIEVTKANIAAAKAYAKTHPTALAKGAIRYFPVRFKVTGNTDGTGEAAVFDLLSLLEAVNRDFEPYNWRFFLEDVDGLPIDYFFDDALNTQLSQNSAFIEGNRAAAAITLYVTGDASTPNGSGVGVTLGYYSPRQDILVVRTSEIGTDAATVSHELGHYFGLPHTFRGWDCVSWEGTVCSDTTYNSPVTETVAPCRLGTRGIAVELVTRGPGANCATAGDLFCDTPADYQFGLGYPSCSYDGAVKDRNGDALAPQEDNFMSYFGRCADYQFSAEQFAAMSADIRSARRSFLSAQAVPISLDSVRLAPQITSPTTGGPSAFGDEVRFAWNPIPGALYYYLEVNTSRTFSDRSAVLQATVPATETSYLLKGLTPNTAYSVRVRAFNQLTVGFPSDRVTFRTGTISGVASREAVQAFAIYPNPSPRGGELMVSFENAQAGDFDLALLDVTGRVLSQGRLRLDRGNTQLPLAGARHLPAGTYLARVSGDVGVSTRRFVVQ